MHWRAAVEAGSRCQTTDQADPDARYLAGWSALTAAKLDSARAEFQTVLAKRPLDPLAAHALGLVEWQAGRLDLADAAFARALSSNANQLSTVIDRARLSIVAGDDGARRRARETLGGDGAEAGRAMLAGPAGARRAGIGGAGRARQGGRHSTTQALDEAQKLAAPTDVLARREIALQRAAGAATPTPTPTALPAIGELTLPQLDALLAAGNRAEAQKRINARGHSPSAFTLIYRGELLLASHAAAAENLGLAALNRRGVSAADKQAGWLLVARARIAEGDRRQGRRAYESAVALDAQSEVGKLAAAELAGLGGRVKRSSAPGRTDRRGR